uniref:Uncharacterized protein n=1 Tax=Ditylenchus dipsaci TaxID=166011 RepID=A0A915DQ69_9BILA
MQVSPIYHDPKYKCCCGTHVERGAYIIAIAGSVLAVLSLLTNIQQLNYPLLSGTIIQIALYLSIIYAQKRRETWLYLPYLILTAIGLFLLTLFIILLIVMSILMPASWINVMQDSDRVGISGTGFKEQDVQSIMRIATAAIAAIYIVFFSISLWFYSVVYRAYKYMQDEQSIRVAPPTLYRV